MAYDGFISYSHAADGELAPALQNALQRLAKPWYRRRALNVFRDETGLSVDPHLWGAIVNALEDAEWFVLLTSPQAAGSEWVNREIEHWKANRPVERILPVVTEGHWQWDEAAGDFTPDSTAVPPSLRGVFTAEPRHLDLRWTRAESQLDLRNGRFRDSVAEVAAPLHGRTKDDIEGEDVRQHRRTIRLAWSAASALAIFALLAVMGAGIAVRNADQAEQRRVEADAQRLVAQSSINLDRPDLAFLLAAEANRLNPSDDAESALLTATLTTPSFRQRLQLDAPVSAVAYDANADLVAVATDKGVVRLFRYSNGERLAERKGLEIGPIQQLAITSAPADDGSIIHVTGRFGILVLDDQLATERSLEVPDEVVLASDVTDDGERFAAGTAAGRLLVWEKASGTPSLDIEAHLDDFPQTNAVVWIGEDSLVTAGSDGVVRRWDITDPDEPMWEITDAALEGDTVTHLEVLPDDRFATGDSTGIVRFWDLGTGTTDDMGAVNRLHFGAITGLAATGDSPDQGSLASVATDGTLVYWNHLTGTPAIVSATVHRGAVSGVAWDTDRPNTGVTGGVDGSVLFLAYLEERPNILVDVFDGWAGPTAAAIEPGGNRVAVADIDNSITITDLDEPRPDGQQVGTEDVVEQMVFSPDGEYVIAGLSDGTLIVWDGESDDIDPADAHDGPVTQLAISADGAMVASNGSSTAEDSMVRLWSFENGRLTLLEEIEAPPAAFGLEFFPDGDRLAIGGQRAFAVHDLDSGQTERVERSDTGVRALAVDSAGETIAVAPLDGPVRFYDADTLEEVGTPLEHPARVGGVAFADDDRRLVTVANDGLRIWQIDRGELVGLPVDVGTAASTPGLAIDNDTVITYAVDDSIIARWPLAVEDWIAAGCDRTARELRPEERERFDIEDASGPCAD